MSRRPSVLLLAEMVEALGRIDRYVSGLDEGAFLQDDRTADAVIRNLEIIGEAAARLPESVRDAAPDVPWRRIVGLRNRIVHEYFAVDLALVWAIVRDEVAVLRRDLESLRRTLDGA